MVPVGKVKYLKNTRQCSTCIMHNDNIHAHKVFLRNPRNMSLHHGYNSLLLTITVVTVSNSNSKPDANL